jgi:hypothetical protein
MLFIPFFNLYIVTKNQVIEIYYEYIDVIPL